MIKWLLFYFKIEQKNVIKANVMYDWIMHDVLWMTDIIMMTIAHIFELLMLQLQLNLLSLL